MREALRYFQNVKEILNKSPIEDDRCEDIKYVQGTCSTAYLAISKALDEYLIGKGLTKKELPRSVHGYRSMLKKYLSAHNGKLIKEFEALYSELHIAGYYRGDLQHVDTVKSVLKAARAFVEKIK